MGFWGFGVLGILGPSYCGIGATIRIGREMLCLPYAGFFIHARFQVVIIEKRKKTKSSKISFPKVHLQPTIALKQDIILGACSILQKK